MVVPEVQVSAPKTRELVALLRDLGVRDCLLLTSGLDENLWLSARNLPGVDVMSAQEVDPVSLIAFEHVVATEAAVKTLEERLS